MDNNCIHRKSVFIVVRVVCVNGINGVRLQYVKN